MNYEIYLSDFHVSGHDGLFVVFVQYKAAPIE